MFSVEILKTKCRIIGAHYFLNHNIIFFITHPASTVLYIHLAVSYKFMQAMQKLHPLHTAVKLNYIQLQISDVIKNSPK